MRITKIHLQNIGVFEDATIEFPEKTDPDKAEIHILTGENGTGKSTVLYALAAPFMEFTHDSPRDYNTNIFSRFRFNNNFSKVQIYEDPNLLFELSGEVKSQAAPYGKVYNTDLNNSNQSKYELKWNPQLILEREFNFAAFAYSGNRILQTHQLTSIEEIRVSPFLNGLSFNQTVDSSLITKWIANTITKESIELRRGNDKKAHRFRTAISRIEETIASIVDEKISFDVDTEPLGVSVKVRDKLLSFDLLPEGLKSIISWIADLLMRLDRIRWATDVEVLDRNFVLFLDEIDVHLHPAWQRKIIPAIQKLFKNAQIFVSTHSPFVVGSVDGAWVHKLVLDENQNSKSEPPRKSEDGESYQYILREVFNIEEQFGVGTERMLAEFRDVKSRILQNQHYDKDAFLKLAHDIAIQSIELSSIIGMELRQLSRIKQADFSI